MEKTLEIEKLFIQEWGFTIAHSRKKAIKFARIICLILATIDTTAPAQTLALSTSAGLHQYSSSFYAPIIAHLLDDPSKSHFWFVIFSYELSVILMLQAPSAS